jgi:perosamine synthetase
MKKLSPEAFKWPPIPSKTLSAKVLRYLKDGRPLSVDGSRDVVEDLESRLRKYFDRKYALLFSSGTAALHAAYFALNLTPGSTIACPVYTYPATVMPMINLGLVPSFCDADSRSANVTEESLSRALVDGVQAVVVTHMWGLPCDMSAINSLASARGLRVIEDASHAPGADVGRTKAGKLADLAVLSFQAFKLLWAGEGGVLLTDDDELYSRAVVFGHNQQRIIDLGSESHYSCYAPYGYGLKLRIHPLAAVIALHALSQLPRIVVRQRMTAKALDAALSDSPLADAPEIVKGVNRVYYTYKPLLKPTINPILRYSLVARLRAKGIPARIPDSGLLSEHPIFKKRLGELFHLRIPRQCGPFPGALHYFNHAITIPFPNMADGNEVKLIATILEDTFRRTE